MQVSLGGVTWEFRSCSWAAKISIFPSGDYFDRRSAVISAYKFIALTEWGPMNGWSASVGLFYPLLLAVSLLVVILAPVLSTLTSTLSMSVTSSLILSSCFYAFSSFTSCGDLLAC